MEDKQIVELYWNRSSDAIQETKEKYGTHLSYIVHHILQNDVDAERCLEECYKIVWDTIPPHRPQNFKAYLYKIARNHALGMRFPELDERATDLFTAELMIQDFLKSLETEQRKIFVAHYWYFSSVSEIAVQYKKSEEVVNDLLFSLKQKSVHFQTEEKFFYAMTEIDDCYLEEAEPLQEKEMEADRKTSHAIPVLWKRGGIAAMCMILLGAAVVLFSQNPTEENPFESGSENGYFDSGTGVAGTENKEEDWEGGEYLKEGDFQDKMKELPWEVTMEISAMPVFKNLAFYSESGETVYLQQSSLLTRAESIVKNLNTRMNHFEYTRTDTGEISMLTVKIDIGEIRIQGNGNVDIIFSEGVEIPRDYQMFNFASTEKANETVSYLVKCYKNILDYVDWSAVSYRGYDAKKNPKMNYRAAGTGAYGIENILAYYFCSVDFSYNNFDGLMGIHYQDLRQVAELVDYYPIISVEEAKLLLQEGKYKSDLMELEEGEYDESLIQGVELMYECLPTEEYFQPYYCFYLKKEDSNNYHAFYVPAIKGGNMEDMLPSEKEVTIIDMGQGTEQEKLVYYRDGQFYTINGFKKIEVKTNEFHSTLTYKEDSFDIHFAWCEVEGELFVRLKNDNTDGEISVEKIPGCTDKVLLYKVLPLFGKEAVFMCDLTQQKITFILDAETANTEVINSVSVSNNIEDIIVNTQKNTKPLLYNGSEMIDLSEVIGIKVDLIGSIVAKFMEDKVFVSNIAYKPGDTYISQYLYDIATKTAVCIIDDERIKYIDGRYATRKDAVGEIEIMNLMNGVSVKTGIVSAEVERIYNVSSQHYAFVFVTGEIVIVEKETGQTIKVFEYKLSFSPTNMYFKNDLLYVEDWNGRYFVFILTN